MKFVLGKIDPIRKKDSRMISPSELANMQRAQYSHDMRNHFDILSLHKNDRLKHYGLHFAKYVGRLARASSEPKPIERTLVDATLVSLSAANTLHQDLGKEVVDEQPIEAEAISFLKFADAAGRFADACEKIDHMENFISIAKEANSDIIHWLVQEMSSRQLNLAAEVEIRRKELADRHFYIL